MPDKMDLDAVILSLEKKYGKGVVGVASKAKAIGSWRRIRTGVFAVDYVLGGGIPYGAATLLYGMESGGKTTLAMKCVAGAQRMCRDCVVGLVPTGEATKRCPVCGHTGPEDVCPNEFCKKSPMSEAAQVLVCPQCKKCRPNKTLYVDAEGSFTNDWAAKLGVNCDLVYVFRPQSAEDAMNVSMILLETGEFDLVVIDTIAQLTPQIERDEDAEKWQQGYLARLVNKALRGWLSQMNVSGVERLRRMTLILINQIRYKIGVQFGDATTRPGGKGQDYAAVVELKLWCAKEEKDELGNTVSAIIGVKVEKNKTNPTSKQEANFRLWKRNVIVEEEEKRAGDTDDHVVLLEHGLKFGAIAEEKAKYVWGDKGEWSFTSQRACLQALKSDSQAAEWVRLRLMGQLIGEVWYSMKELEKKRKQRERWND